MHYGRLQQHLFANNAKVSPLVATHKQHHEEHLEHDSIDTADVMPIMYPKQDPTLSERKIHQNLFANSSKASPLVTTHKQHHEEHLEHDSIHTTDVMPIMQYPKQDLTLSERTIRQNLFAIDPQVSPRVTTHLQHHDERLEHDSVHAKDFTVKEQANVFIVRHYSDLPMGDHVVHVDDGCNYKEQTVGPHHKQCSMEHLVGFNPLEQHVHTEHQQLVRRRCQMGEVATVLRDLIAVRPQATGLELLEEFLALNCEEEHEVMAAIPWGVEALRAFGYDIVLTQ